MILMIDADVEFIFYDDKYQYAWNICHCSIHVQHTSMQ